MANKTNQDRTRRIRTVILSASLLSFIPLVGVMQQGGSNSQDVALAPPTEPVAAAQLVSYSTGTASATAQAAAIARPETSSVETSTGAAQTVAAESKATTTAQATPASSYTRTKAS